MKRAKTTTMTTAMTVICDQLYHSYFRDRNQLKSMAFSWVVFFKIVYGPKCLNDLLLGSLFNWFTNGNCECCYFILLSSFCCCFCCAFNKYHLSHAIIIIIINCRCLNYNLRIENHYFRIERDEIIWNDRLNCNERSNGIQWEKCIFNLMIE